MIMGAGKHRCISRVSRRLLCRCVQQWNGLCDIMDDRLWTGVVVVMLKWLWYWYVRIFIRTKPRSRLLVGSEGCRRIVQNWRFLIYWESLRCVLCRLSRLLAFGSCE